MKKIVIILFFILISSNSTAHMAHYNKYNKIEMDILRNGELIGYNYYFFTRNGEETIVTNQIKFSVKLLGATIFQVEGYGEEKYFKNQLISFQSHGVTHSAVSSLNEEEIELEMINSKKIIESHTNKKVHSFCYPYGSKESIGDIAPKVAAEHNIKLMNAISKSEVFAENKLFATLDTTVRKVVIRNLPFLLTDTVGFIRKLPTQLVESFKSTLDEVREADLLLHVVDISHHNFEEHIASVNQILDEIDSADKPSIMVFNKIDAYEPETIDEDDLDTEKTTKHNTLEDWKKTWMNRTEYGSLFISALNKDNFDELRKTVYNAVREIHVTRFPYNSFLYPEYDDDFNEQQ